MVYRIDILGEDMDAIGNGSSENADNMYWTTQTTQDSPYPSMWKWINYDWISNRKVYSVHQPQMGESLVFKQHIPFSLEYLGML